MKKRLVINALEPREIRAVILDEHGKLQNLFMERAEKKHQKGDIFMARVNSIEPHLQAAFVEIEQGRHAFLSVNDIIVPDAGASLLAAKPRKKAEAKEPKAPKASKRKKKGEEAAPVSAEGQAADAAGEAPATEPSEASPEADAAPADEARTESRSEPKPSKKHYKIQDLLKKGQTLVVQIIKEGIGKKAPVVTNYLGLAGRYAVMTPGEGKISISRRLSENSERDRLSAVVEKAKLAAECGVIIRTASEGVSDKDLLADLKSLAAFWTEVKKKAKAMKGTGVLHKEPGLITRLVRDYYDTEFGEILVDTQEAHDEIKGFLEEKMPDELPKLKLEQGAPVFARHRIEESIAELYKSRVNLPGGGSLIFEQTEAMLSIDVNSGSFRGSKDDEEAAFQINMVAAREVARQVMLRDAGGLLMIDFVDLRKRGNREKVEKELARAFRDDKAKINITHISELGVLEMTRQRTQESLRNRLSSRCERCGGTGVTPSLEFSGISCLRAIRELLGRCRYGSIRLLTTQETAIHVLNVFRSDLEEMETSFDVDIEVQVDPAIKPGAFRMEARHGQAPVRDLRDGERRHREAEDEPRKQPAKEAAKAEEPEEPETPEERDEAPAGEADAAPSGAEETLAPPEPDDDRGAAAGERGRPEGEGSQGQPRHQDRRHRDRHQRDRQHDRQHGQRGQQARHGGQQGQGQQGQQQGRQDQQQGQQGQGQPGGQQGGSGPHGSGLSRSARRRRARRMRELERRGQGQDARPGQAQGELRDQAGSEQSAGERPPQESVHQEHASPSDQQGFDPAGPAMDRPEGPPPAPDQAEGGQGERAAGGGGRPRRRRRGSRGRNRGNGGGLPNETGPESAPSSVDEPRIETGGGSDVGDH